MSFLSLFEILFWLLRLRAPKSKQGGKHPILKDDCGNLKIEKKTTCCCSALKDSSSKQESFESALRLKGNCKNYYWLRMLQSILISSTIVFGVFYCKYKFNDIIYAFLAYDPNIW